MTTAARAFAVCVVIWSTTWLAITFQLGEVAPEASVAWRFGLAALVAAGICRWRRLRLCLPLRDHALLVPFGLTMFCLGYIAVYRAELILVSGLVAVGYAVSPLVNMVASRVGLGTAMTARHAAAGLLGVAGVALVFWPEVAGFSATPRAGHGVLLIAGAVLASAVGNVFATLLERRGLSVWQRLTWGMFYGAAGCLAAALLTGQRLGFSWTWPYVASLLYLALLGSVIAFAAYLVLLERAGAVQAGYVGVMVPIAALGVSAVFEQFSWGPWTVAGVLVAATGNVLVLRRSSAAER